MEKKAGMEFTGAGIRTVLAGMDEILEKLRASEKVKELAEIIDIIDELEIHCAELTEIVDKLDGICATLNIITEN